ncbi:MAG TPA: hypothetical protein VGO48_08505 [Conexibacter sp.]|nr:hypothetical protein [Conexibacter sp.]
MSAIVATYRADWRAVIERIDTPVGTRHVWLVVEPARHPAVRSSAG